MDYTKDHYIREKLKSAYCRLHNILKEVADGEELKLQWWNIEMVEKDTKDAKKAYKECFSGGELR